MEPGIPIGVFSVLSFVSGLYIWRRDAFFGAAYFFLFVYTVFAQIGYAYFPKISEGIRAYFGPEVFFEVNLFVALSFCVFFVCFIGLYRRVVARPLYGVVRLFPRPTGLFYILVGGHLFGMSAYVNAKYDLLTYANSYDQTFIADEGVGYLLFGIAFKFSVAVIFILYFLLRVRESDYSPRVSRNLVLILMVLELLVFVLIAARLGNRTDLLALVLSISVLEIELARKRTRSGLPWLKISLLVGVLLYGAGMIEVARTAGAVDGRGLAERILFKDYYYPSHVLIAAMALDYVDPLEVIASNMANALMMLKHPYLQETVVELFNPGVSTRSSSYAFYIFSEGYLAAGWFGVLYNGLIVFFGLAIWRKLANSSSHYYSLFMTGLLASQIANLVRGQSSYFIKYIYMFVVPAMLLFALATGILPRLSLGLRLGGAWRGKARQVPVPQIWGRP